MLLFTSCERNEVSSPDFEVTTISDTVKVGEPIVFNFKGNPNNITFYSGEVGKKFEFRNRVYAPDNKLSLRFTSLVQSGVINNLSLLVSNDFSGIADTNAVKNAHWTNISSRAVFSTGSDNTPSGTIDFSEFSDSDLPVCMAFRYTTDVIQAQNRWVIRTANIESNNQTDGISSLATMATAGWLSVSFKNPTAFWTITSAQLLMAGGNTALDDDWVISKNFEVKKVNPDVGTPIKDITTKLSTYSYKYSTPATYQIAFVVSNITSKGLKEQVKLLKITVIN